MRRRPRQNRPPDPLVEAATSGRFVAVADTAANLKHESNQQKPIRGPPQLQRFLRLPDVIGFIGLKRTQIYKLVATGAFPKPIPISDTGIAVAWLESEVAQWQASRIAKPRVSKGGKRAKGKRHSRTLPPTL